MISLKENLPIIINISISPSLKKYFTWLTSFTSFAFGTDIWWQHWGLWDFKHSNEEVYVNESVKNELGDTLDGSSWDIDSSEILMHTWMRREDKICWVRVNYSVCIITWLIWIVISRCPLNDQGRPSSVTCFIFFLISPPPIPEFVYIRTSALASFSLLNS